MSRCPGPHLLSCGVCGGTDAGLRARAEAAERERDRLRGALEELMEWEDEIAASLGLHTNPAPLMAKARAALAGEGEATPEKAREA